MDTTAIGPTADKIVAGLRTMPSTQTSPTSEPDLRRCPICRHRHPAGEYIAHRQPCESCRGRSFRAASWASADADTLLDKCRGLGIGPRFCRGGMPPSLKDVGLVERIAKHPLPKGGLLVVGPVGSHKTHLLAARTVYAARKGYTARLLKWSTFCLEVRSTYQASSRETEADVLERYVDLDYLALDDLSVGREDKPETDAALRLAYALFDARYEACRITDVSSNCTPDELVQRFDPRIHRRIMELCTVYPMLLGEVQA